MRIWLLTPPVADVRANRSRESAPGSSVVASIRAASEGPMSATVVSEEELLCRDAVSDTPGIETRWLRASYRVIVPGSGWPDGADNVGMLTLRECGSVA